MNIVAPFRIVLLLLGLFACTSCSHADSGRAITKVYGQSAGVPTDQLSLDIYPAPKQAAPVVVYVHGGAWRTGDKANVHGKADFFTRNGYQFVSINYRLEPAPPYPGNVQDVAAAIAWVHKFIDQYGGNPDQIFLMGHSAGAHLVALAMTDQAFIKRYGLATRHIQAMALLDGASYDVAASMEHRGRDEAAVRAFGTNPEIWKRASPIAHLGGGKRIPPTLVVGIGKSPVRTKWHQAFYSALKRNGHAAKYFEARGQSHGSLNKTFGQSSNPATEAVLQFFAQN